jgi:hypothetical protein
VTLFLTCSNPAKGSSRKAAAGRGGGGASNLTKLTVVSFTIFYIHAIAHFGALL